MNLNEGGGGWSGRFANQSLGYIYNDSSLTWQRTALPDDVRQDQAKITFGGYSFAGTATNGMVTGVAVSYAGTVLGTDLTVEASRERMVEGHQSMLRLMATQSGDGYNTSAYADWRQAQDGTSGIGAGGTVSGSQGNPSASLDGNWSSTGDKTIKLEAKVTFPLILDLDGDGVELVDLDRSATFLDIDADGFKENVGWIAGDDGILVVDGGGDGVVDGADEFVLTRLAPGSTSDLEALDYNLDGKLTDADPRWSQMKVWRDLDQDGVSDAGELQSLAQAGIVELSLDGLAAVQDDGTRGLYQNVVSAVASYRRTDGGSGALYDVGLLHSGIGYAESGTAAGGVVLEAEDHSRFLQLSDAGGTVDAALVSGLTGAMGGAGADVLGTSGSAIVVLDGGGGDDTVSGGAGHDILFVDGEDVAVDGGDGLDVVIGVGASGLSLDVGAAQVEAVYGTAAGDALSTSGTAGVVLYGAGGADILAGGSGGDTLVGDAGADTLLGGAGDDALFIDADDSLVRGGDGYDVVFVQDSRAVTLDAGAMEAEAILGSGGADMLSSSGTGAVLLGGGAGADTLTGGAGADVLVGGLDGDVIEGGGGDDVAVYLGLFADYQVTRNADGSVTVTDNKPELWGDEGADSLRNVERLTFADRTIYVDGRNNAPIADRFAWAKGYSGQWLRLTSAELLAAHGDLDGDGMSVASVAGAAHGQVSWDAGGVWFRPDDGYTGRARFDYVVRDAQGAETSATALVTVQGAKPTDPYFSSQWHLDSIGAPAVWTDYTGRGVTVSILDNGVDYTHPDLDGNYDTSRDWDYVQGDSDPFPTVGGEGHGTELAGIVAAERNGTGVVGVAYGATVVGSRTGISPLSATRSAWSQAFRDQAKYDVVNMSWGGVSFSSNAELPNEQTYRLGPMAEAARQGRGGLGTGFVASGGNARSYGGNANYGNKENSRFVAAVAALGQNGRFASYSSPGANLLVTAPGDYIIGPDAKDPYGYVTGGDYVAGSGTSASAPVVAGVVALLLEANPLLGARDVQEILALSARRTDPTSAGWAWNGAAGWNGGGLHVSHDCGLGAVAA